MRPYTLLSFDGGGIRGYISARILAALDVQTGGSLMARVQGLCGTSTGSLIALGLASGMTAAELVKLYRDNATEIFSPRKESGLGKLEDEAAKHLGLPDPHLLFHPKYEGSGLRRVITSVLSDARMKDAGRDVAINAARLWDATLQPARWHAATATSFEPEFADDQMVDLAMASAAAPTFFPPHEIPGKGYFADGGTFANNPVLNCFVALRRAGKVQQLEDLEVVSIGTGLAPTSMPPSAVGNPDDWGVWAWVSPISTHGRPSSPLVTGLMELSATSIEDIADGLFDRRLARIQPILEDPIPMDGHDIKTFEAMDAAAEHAIASPAFAKAKALIETWGPEHELLARNTHS